MTCSENLELPAGSAKTVKLQLIPFNVCSFLHQWFSLGYCMFIVERAMCGDRNVALYETVAFDKVGPLPNEILIDYA